MMRAIIKTFKNALHIKIVQFVSERASYYIYMHTILYEDVIIRNMKENIVYYNYIRGILLIIFE